MTPGNIPATTAGAPGPAPLRPPDFLVPQTEPNVRRRTGTPDIYLSWGQQVYGPSGVDDVLRGVRAASFEADALFWFEGQNEWRPIAEFPDLFADDSRALAAPTDKTPPAGPSQHPPAGMHRPSHMSSRRSGSKRRSKGGKTRPRVHGRTGRRGKLVVLAAVLLAVALTAVLLMLLSRV
jgi:hypothetical protein